MLSLHTTRVCGGTLLACIWALSIGCGPNYKARGTVKGKVTLAGKPLTAGSVMFYGQNNLTGSATIDKNGNYIMKDAPLGEVKVTVSVPNVPAGSGPSSTMPPVAMKSVKGSVNPENPNQRISIMGEPPPPIVSIPAKYASPDTSGLTYKVEKGEHVFDIDLKP